MCDGCATLYQRIRTAPEKQDAIRFRLCRNHHYANYAYQLASYRPFYKRTTLLTCPENMERANIV